MTDGIEERALKRAQDNSTGADVAAQLASLLTAFAKEEVKRALEEAAKIAERWNSPVTDSEFVNAQAIAAQQIAAYIRTLKESTND